MATKKNAPQGRGVEVVRASGNLEADYTQAQTPQGSDAQQGLKCRCAACFATLTELERDKRRFAHMAYGVVPGSKEAFRALAEVHRQIVALRERML